MKNLMKIFSILLVGCLAVIIVGLNFEVDTTFADVTNKITGILLESIIPIAIIAVSCLCLQKKTEGVLMNVVLAIATVSVILSSITYFLPIDDIGEEFATVVTTTKAFIEMINIYLLFFSLLKVVNPNNMISNIMQKTGYIAMIANIVFQIWLKIKIGLVETLPNVYGHDGFNFSTVPETEALVTKVYVISMLIEIFAIVLTYITNHAFEIDTIDVDQMDYDELKKQADSVAQSQFNNIYTINSDEKKEEPTPTPTKPGIMNINNQLGTDSNVGQIENKQKTPTTGFVDRGIPTSNGPVINNNISQDNMSTQPSTVSPNVTPNLNNFSPNTVPAQSPSIAPPTPPVQQNNSTLNNSPLAQALGNTPQTNNGQTNKFLN